MNDLIPSGASLPVEITERLDSWAIEAQAAFSDNTLRAYASDSRAYAEWCAAQDVSTFTLPSPAAQVAAFLRSESERGKAVATVRRRAATISRMHMAAELPNPCASELVKLALKGIARTRGTDQRQAEPLTERDTMKIRAHLNESSKDVRDVALMLVARDLLARSSELVALDVAGVEYSTAGATVRLRRSKTSTETSSCFIGDEAAAALRAWLERAAISSGPVFQSVTRSGQPTGRALDTRDVRRIFKEIATRANLANAGGISGHSARVGMAQDLIAADLNLAAVMQAGAWSTPRMVARYTQKLSASRGAVARYYGHKLR